MMSMPMHILLGLFNACKKQKEEEAEAEKKQQDGGMSSVPSINSLMSQAKSGMPSARMPSGMPNVNSFRH